VKEDHRQFSRLVPENFGDIRRGFPIHHLPAHSSPLENEMKERPWTTILVIGGWPFPDGDFDRHREFLEGRAVLIVR
jgi:hypothetical protein